MKFNDVELPAREVLLQFAEQVPEIHVPSVEVLLRLMKAANAIQHRIFDILEKEHKLSAGKWGVMIILYREPEGLSPSQLADKAGVTRATISAMLQRMIRDGLAYSFSDAHDGRGKVVALTEEGKNFLKDMLPAHFLRTAALMKKLNAQEQEQLVALLDKII